MDKMMLKTQFGRTIPVTFKKAKYVSFNNLYVGIDSWEDGYPEPWSDLTVNLGVPMEPDCAFIDINNNGKGIIDWLVENNIAVPTGNWERSGFCTYPEVRFNKELLDKIEEA